jgi:hypothetical protein
VCVSSGYGGEMMWRDVITTDQNILQDDQDPQVEILAAIFPSQLEAGLALFTHATCIQNTS